MSAPEEAPSCSQCGKPCRPGPGGCQVFQRPEDKLPGPEKCELCELPVYASDEPHPMLPLGATLWLDASGDGYCEDSVLGHVVP